MVAAGRRRKVLDRTRLVESREANRWDLRLRRIRICFHYPEMLRHENDLS